MARSTATAARRLLDGRQVVGLHSVGRLYSAGVGKILAFAYIKPHAAGTSGTTLEVVIHRQPTHCPRV